MKSSLICGFLGLLLASPVPAAIQLTVVGDSLTKEYEISFPGVPLAGVAGIDPTNPGARNWAEILHARRGDFFHSGSFRNSLLNRWSDLRLLGHEYNWAVPGATARAIRNLITGQNLEEITSDGDFSTFISFAPDWDKTSERMLAQVQASSGAVVIWCGGNDLRFGNDDPATFVNGSPITYQSIYDGDGTGRGDPQPLMNSLKASIQEIAQKIRQASATVPIAICSVPHVGIAPIVKASAPTDAARTGRITTALQALNGELKTWTENTLGGAWVDLHPLTAPLLDAPTVEFGGVTFYNASDTQPASAPASAHNRFLFSHDGFHPGTALQSLVALAVEEALREKFPATFGASAPLTAREVVSSVLSLPANIGFLEFMETSGAPADQRGPSADPDQDGLDNLAEFALAGNIAFPGGAVVAPAAGYDAGAQALTLTWTPRSPDNAYCAITCEHSTTAASWSGVPASQITANADGSWTARVPADGPGPKFMRLKITAAP